MSEALQAPRGTRDLLPAETARWAEVEAVLRDVYARFGYRELRTPIFEHTELYVRGIGEATDIVGKEMYTFSDRGGRSLTLRPEGTAGVVRSYVEHSLGQGDRGEAKLFYLGPMFRYERPQKGRYRQFWQAGAEAIGYADPAADAESIAMLVLALRELGLKGLQADVNSVGDAETRADFRGRLQDFVRGWGGSISNESRARLETNPLRILDSKDPDDEALVAAAPKVTNHLSTRSSAHFAGVLRHLDRLGVPYEVNKKLVRGLDYYSDTVFEVLSSDLGAQSAVAGGGRYDGLVGQFQKQARPAVGWAIGLDRLTVLLEQAGLVAGHGGSQVAVCTLGGAAFGPGLALAQSLREAGVSVWFDSSGQRGLKNQFKQADAEGCALALVLGEDELARGEASLKDMKKGEQSPVALDAVVAEVKRRLN
ncbi:MAG TPA: histidine--tRNA ligase [bacterium]|nr:histidine--tRNA ligase [bacterium]